MRLVFIDAYFCALLAITLSTGMTLLQRLLSLCWIVVLLLWSVNALRRGLALKRLVRSAFYSQIPAAILVIAAPIAPVFKLDGLTDGILTIWETPFEPLFELIPSFHIGYLSSMYLEECALPFLLPVLTILLGWSVRSCRMT